MGNTKECQDQNVLEVVYNSIDCDNRAQRTAETLSEYYTVTVLSIDLGNKFRDTKFRSIVVTLPNLRRFKILRHLCFWFYILITTFKSKPNIIYAHNYFVLFPSWIAARLIGAKLVYDAYEFIIPDKFKTYSYRDRCWYILERWTVKRADFIIAANRVRAKLMAEHYRLLKVPVAIRNIPPMPHSKFSDKEVLIHYPILRRDKDDKIILVYQGYINLDRGIGNFVDAMKYLDKRFFLLIIGSGPDLDVLKIRVAKAGLRKRVLFTGRIPRVDLYDVLRMCDIGILTYSKIGINNVYCSPNKIYEYAQAYLPVITTDQPPLRSIIDQYYIGAYISDSNNKYNKKARVIAECIKNFVLDQYSTKSIKTSIRIFIEENSWDKEKKKLLKVFQKIHGTYNIYGR